MQGPTTLIGPIGLGHLPASPPTHPMPLLTIVAKHQNPASIISWGSNGNVTIIVQMPSQLLCTTCQTVIIPTAELPHQPPVQSTNLIRLIRARYVHMIKSQRHQLAWAEYVDLATVPKGNDPINIKSEYVLAHNPPPPRPSPSYSVISVSK